VTSSAGAASSREPVVTLSPEQRVRLLRAKLVALVRDHTGREAEATEVGTSVGLVADGHAAVLIEDGHAAALAGALLWADRQQAKDLTVYVDTGAEQVARWAGYFSFGDGPVQVRRVTGGTSEPATAAPLPAPLHAPDGVEELTALLRAEGLEVVVEQGQVRGEVLGLEVARLVRWPAEVGGDGELHLEAGVGRFDRDAVAAARPDESPEVALARTVEQVRAHRFPGAPVHPLQLLARPRWLRATAIEEPASVGARRLEPVDMTTEAQGLKDVHPAAAFGVGDDGEPMVLVCSTGVDLSLVPLAADTRELHDPGARLVLALPGRDHHRATVALAGLLREPAELVDLAPGWG
jgi:hypothetical protein